MPATFEVVGPIRAPYKKPANGRVFDPDGLEDFWEDTECGRDTGVYIFAIRTAQGKIWPWYVGKTFRSFKKETFTDHKRVKYSEAMIENGQGTPLFFFLAETGKGAVNRRATTELEGDYINHCFQVNSRVKNERGIRSPRYLISSIGTAGGKPKAVRELLKMLGT